MPALFWALSVALAVGGFAERARATFIPENEIRLRSDRSEPANISEAEFNQVIAMLQSHFAPLASAKGGELNIQGDWASKKLNAGANQMLSSWMVQISGEIARQPQLTVDGLTLIVCHELGHHFGGFPLSAADSPFQGAWAAVEGQADYFSTQVCARKFWAQDAAKNAQARASVKPAAKAGCDRGWGSQGLRDLCYRTAVGAESVIATMASLMQKPMPNFATPDASAVAQTIPGHPGIQCRLDTLFQGTICPAKFNQDVIPGKSVAGGIDSLDAEKEAAANSCAAASGYSLGLRPNCWFRPRL
jgi:hypothetical protein